MPLPHPSPPRPPQPAARWTSSRERWTSSREPDVVCEHAGGVSAHEDVNPPLPRPIAARRASRAPSPSRLKIVGLAQVSGRGTPPRPAARWTGSRLSTAASQEPRRSLARRRGRRERTSRAAHEAHASAPRTQPRKEARGKETEAKAMTRKSGIRAARGRHGRPARAARGRTGASVVARRERFHGFVARGRRRSEWP